MLLQFNNPYTSQSADESVTYSPPQPNSQLLAKSPYEGLQQVMGTDYFYHDNQMYEKQPAPSRTLWDALGRIYGMGQLSNNRWTPPGSSNIYRGNQGFRRVNPEVSGFNRFESDGGYAYTPTLTSEVVAQPPNAFISQPFLSSPDSNLWGELSSGAGRFLTSDSLLGD